MSRYYSIEQAKNDSVDGGQDDATLQRTINEVEAIFESVTDRRFDSRELPLTFDGDGSTMLYIREYPIISITSLTIDDVLIPATFYAVYNDRIQIIQNYRLNIYAGTSSYAFTKGTQNIDVVGTFGFAADADALIMVTRAIRLMTKAATGGSLTKEDMESEKIGDYSYKNRTGSGSNQGGDQSPSVFGKEVDTIIRQLKRRISLQVI